MITNFTADEVFCAWYRDQPRTDKDLSDSDLMDCSISGCTMLWVEYEVEPATSFLKAVEACASRNPTPSYFK